MGKQLFKHVRIQFPKYQMILTALPWMISKFLFVLSMKFENQFTYDFPGKFYIAFLSKRTWEKLIFFLFHKYCDFHYLERCINPSLPQLTIDIYSFKLFSLWDTRPNLDKFVNIKPANNVQT